jgi:hypothetical protein
VAAAALAGEPSDVQFELERPEREEVTRTVKPKPKPEPKPEKKGKKGNKNRR